MVWDAVVVGLGGVGSFCLRALARGCASHGTNTKSHHHPKRSRRILGLEAFGQRGHDRGSSHGGSRIYRRAYFEHANYVPWIEFSLQEFRDLEQSSGWSLMQECGTLLIEPQQRKNLDNNNNQNSNNVNQSSSTTQQQHCTKSFLERAWDSANQHDIPVQFLSNTELKQSFPQFRITDADSVGLLEPGGGFVRPERAIVAALQQAEEQYGATIWEHSTITSIKEVPNNNSNINNYNNNQKNLVEIQLRRRRQQAGSQDDNNSTIHNNDNNGDDDETVTILAKTVLVTAGAWTGKLLPTLAPYIKVTRQIQGWLDMGGDHDTNNNNNSNQQQLDPTMYHPSRMPTWVMISPHVTLPLYGIPADPDATIAVPTTQQQQQPQQQHWIKVGLHGRDCPVDPTQPQAWAHPTIAEQRELQHAYSQVLTDAHPQGRRRSCLVIKKTKSCYYEMTPDQHFLIGVPRGYTHVGCVGGLSGHGFKMTPALGQMLADFALLQIMDNHENEQNQLDQNAWSLVEQKWKTQFCSPARFGV